MQSTMLFPLSSEVKLTSLLGCGNTWGATASQPQKRSSNSTGGKSPGHLCPGEFAVYSEVARKENPGIYIHFLTGLQIE